MDVMMSLGLAKVLMGGMLIGMPVERPMPLPETVALTCYTDNEDRWGSTTAYLNPWGERKSIPGLTVAGPDWMAGLWIEINGRRYFVADRGRDVEANVAGKARGQLMTIDVYVGSGLSQKQLSEANAKLGEVGTFRIVDAPSVAELEQMRVKYLLA